VTPRKVFLILCLILLLPGFLRAEEPFWPNDPYFFYNPVDRPNFPGQWHLVNMAPAELVVTGGGGEVNTAVNVGIDTNLKGAWDLGYTGKGVVIGIVDSGLQADHPDIAPNYRADLSTAPSAWPSAAHGTSVAGIAAARGGNGIGGTGAAPYAGIAGIYGFGKDRYLWKSGLACTEQGGILTCDRTGAPEIQIQTHVHSMYWGSNVDRQAWSLSAKNGVIHVSSAGNRRSDEQVGDANFDTLNSNPDAITVGALGSDGKYSYYSQYGSNLFVTAPSSSGANMLAITTTDMTGEEGYTHYGSNHDPFPDQDYMSCFGGTSSSTPLVAGILALGLEANPAMDVRMAKHVLARTSTRVDPNDASQEGGWVQNAAGFWFNRNYGFGNINAGKFVETVRKVAYVTEQTSWSTGFQAVNQSLQPGVEASRSFTLTTAELPASLRQPLEGIEVGLRFAKEAGNQDFNPKATLLSPSGTTNHLFFIPSGYVEDSSLTVSTNAFWGEEPLGQWTLGMTNTMADSYWRWDGYNVTFYMGDIVFFDALPAVQSADMKARSFTLAEAGSSYTIPAGRLLQVQDRVTIDGGHFAVDGTLTEAPGYIGTLFTQNGGLVSGNGIINAGRGYVHNGGTLAPGNSVGHLTIAGDYTQGPAGTLSIEVSPTGNDLLTVNGAASLGGSLEALWAAGFTPAARSAYTFLTATGGVSGTFGGYNRTYITPTLTFSPRYETNQVSLLVERDYGNPYLLPNLSENQRAVMGALNGIAATATGDLDAVLAAIDAQTTASQVAASLDQIAPRGDMATAAISMNGSRMQSAGISSRLQDLRSGVRGFSLRGLNLTIDDDRDLNRRGKPILLAFNGDTPPLDFKTDAGEKWGIFATGNGTLGNIRDDASQSDNAFRSAGFTLGADYRFTDHLAVGLMAGYNRFWSDLDGAGSKGTIDNTLLGVYGTYDRDGLYLDGLLSAGWNSTDKDRRIVYPGVDRTAASSQKGRTWAFSAGAGYDHPVGNWVITPKANIDYVRLATEDYTESGAGALNLQVNGKSSKLLLGQIGASAAYLWKTDKAVLIPRISVMYGLEFDRNDRFDTTARLAAGGSAFTTYSTPPGRNALNLGAGITASLPRGMSLYLHAGGQVGQSDFAAYSLNAGLKLPF
jgi:outer membrane autotransporter protein